MKRGRKERERRIMDKQNYTRRYESVALIKGQLNVTRRNKYHAIQFKLKKGGIFVTACPGIETGF